MGAPRHRRLKVPVTMPTQAPPFVRYDITLQVQRPVAWPHFAGSALRGAFGHALRRVACVTGQPHCQGCTLRSQCAYGAVFEPAPPTQPLHPSFRNGIPRYLVQPPGLGAAPLHAGQTIHWSLLLLPGAHTHRSLIELALGQRLGQHLFEPGQLQTTHMAATELPWPYSNPAPTRGDIAALPHQDSWRLQLITPLRLQKDGQPLRRGEDITPSVLVRAALRRQLQACQLAGLPAPDPAPALAAANECNADTRLLRWHDMRRHSSRQDRHLPLGGLLGTLNLQGTPNALATLRPLMMLAQRMHLGKETIVGLGRISGVPGDNLFAPSTALETRHHPQPS